FEPEIATFGEMNCTDQEAPEARRQRAINVLREWYDGYRFHPNALPVYNPFSTFSALSKSTLRSYWFDTGTPTFLIRLIQQQGLPLEDLEGVRLPSSAFSEIDPERLGAIPILFQSGYVTLREYLPSVSSYLLGYPNREVKQSFVELLADRWARLEPPQRGGTLIDLTMAVLEGRVDDFLTHLRAFFANIPYDLHVPREKYYQTIFYLVFRLVGFNVQAEVKHASGRTDAIIETKDRVYLFEFKLDRASAEDALKQIDDKGYATPYLGAGKQVTKVGVEFDSELRNIERWVVG
ncbi:MAG: PD-(D/E)XK nuclease domain-containing protein, partial [Myxococcales bacterium]